jgi:hypothetical protein
MLQCSFRLPIRHTIQGRADFGKPVTDGASQFGFAADDGAGENELAPFWTRILR